MTDITNPTDIATYTERARLGLALTIAFLEHATAEMKQFQHWIDRTVPLTSQQKIANQLTDIAAHFQEDAEVWLHLLDNPMTGALVDAIAKGETPAALSDRQHPDQIWIYLPLPKTLRKCPDEFAALDAAEMLVSAALGGEDPEPDAEALVAAMVGDKQEIHRIASAVSGAFNVEGKHHIVKIRPERRADS